MSTMTYVAPRMVVDAPREYTENELPVFVAAAGWVLLVFGSAWGYCKAVCGWSNVKSCDAGWLQVKAVCKK